MLRSSTSPLSAGLCLAFALMSSSASAGDSQRGASEGDAHGFADRTEMGKSPEQRVRAQWSGEKLADHCGAYRQPTDAAACRTIARGHSFDVRAARLCLESASHRSDQSLECLTEIADQEFRDDTVAFCAGLGSSRHVSRCLRSVSGRNLDARDLARCSDHGSPGRATRCIERARDYVFDPEELHHLAASVVAESPPEVQADAELDSLLANWAHLEPQVRARVAAHEAEHGRREQERMEAMFARLQDQLIAAHPDANVDTERNNFVYNFAGGANGQYHVLYCSPSEYVIIFGSPTEINGYSGRYDIAIHDWLLEGLMQVYYEGDHRSEKFYPGTHAYLDDGRGKIYSTRASSYMLEYGRGRISTAWDFGVKAPARNVTRDRDNRRNQVRACRDIAVREIFAKPKRKRERRKQQRKIRREIERALRDAEATSTR